MNISKLTKRTRFTRPILFCQKSILVYISRNLYMKQAISERQFLFTVYQREPTNNSNDILLSMTARWRASPLTFDGRKRGKIHQRHHCGIQYIILNGYYIGILTTVYIEPLVVYLYNKGKLSFTRNYINKCVPNNYIQQGN